MTQTILKKGMIKKAWLILSEVVQKYRFALWVVLILLTATLLLFPFYLHYEYQVIESAYVFGGKLPLFGALYYIWSATILLLLFSSYRSDELQRLVLVCIFALVFFGIWVINTPNGDHPDVLYQLAHIEYLQKTGRIALNQPNLGYFQFPGFQLIALSLSQISGLEIFETRTLFLLFSGILFVTVLYLLFVKFLKSSYLASLAVLLMVQGSQVKQTQEFWPGNLSFIFLVILLTLLIRWEMKTAKRAGALVIVILFATFIISYLPTPTFFLFILAGIYLLQRVAKKSIVHPLAIALFLTLFLVWQMYWLISPSTGLVGMIPNFVAGLMNPVERLAFISQPGEAYLGGATPLWASLTRYLWLILIFGFGGLLWIWNLIHVRKLSSIKVLETGGLLGVSVLSIILALTFSWETQWTRFMWLAPLFTIPIMLRFLSSFTSHKRARTLGFDSKRLPRRVTNFEEWFRKHVFILLIVLSLVLSLPTLLIYNGGLYTNAVYSYDRAAGGFSQLAYGAGGLDFFSTATTKIWYTYYLPDAHLHFSPAPQLATNRTELWKEMNNLVDDFEANKENAIFALTEEFRLPPGYPRAIEPTDPRWVGFLNRLAENDKIYGNGHIEIYQHSP